MNTRQTREAQSKSRKKKGYQDTEEYTQDQINLEKWGYLKWEKEILDYLVTPKPDFPKSYWEAFLASPVPQPQHLDHLTKILTKQN